MKNEEFERLIKERNTKAVLTLAEDDEYIVPRIQHLWEGYQMRQSEIDALKAEVERLRKDAERYRWLREHVAEIDFWGDEFVLDREQLDEHIDALMKETK